MHPLVVGNTYEWSTGETSNCITVDMPGIYSVTVTDPNGCFSVCGEEIILNLLPQCTITGDFSLRRRIQRALHASGGRQHL
ncbi:MAG: hypothetical protein H6573_08620 [Lewinellaceae bacterium]|nr:hypothetical protein [Lewinellaceae bacterium]